MKKQFMVAFELPNPLPIEFIRAIPEQRDTINYLLTEGTVKSYSLAVDRSVLWMVVAAETDFAAMEVIAQLPLTDYMTPKVSELAFHNSSDMVLQFSLN
ncbi:MAG: muconolactone Delta-isomerase family protein [Saprospiraceae bacterium]